MPSKLRETSPRGQFPESSFKYTPLQHLRVLYCRFVQGLFSAAPRGAYHWDENEAISEIFVTDENVLDPEVIGTRPAISFTRSPVQFYTLGMDDMNSFDFSTGQKQKSVLVPGVMHINCCSRNDLESEQLAWVIAEQLWMNRDLLMQAGFFDVGRQSSIGAPSPAGNLIANDMGREWYATTVACPFQFYRTGNLTPLGVAIVKGINLSLSTARAPAQPSHGYPYDPSGLPYQVEGFRPPAFSPASDASGGTPNPGYDAEKLPLVPDPLNPAQKVTVHPIYPFQQKLRPPSINGRPIPIRPACVEESPLSVEVITTVKV